MALTLKINFRNGSSVFLEFGADEVGECSVQALRKSIDLAEPGETIETAEDDHGIRHVIVKCKLVSIEILRDPADDDAQSDDNDDEEYEDEDGSSAFQPIPLRAKPMKEGAALS